MQSPFWAPAPIFLSAFLWPCPDLAICCPAIRIVHSACACPERPSLETSLTRSSRRDRSPWGFSSALCVHFSPALGCPFLGTCLISSPCYRDDLGSCWKHQAGSGGGQGAQLRAPLGVGGRGFSPPRTRISPGVRVLVFRPTASTHTPPHTPTGTHTAGLVPKLRDSRPWEHTLPRC